MAGFNLWYLFCQSGPPCYLLPHYLFILLIDQYCSSWELCYAYMDVTSLSSIVFGACNGFSNLLIWTSSMVATFVFSLWTNVSSFLCFLSDYALSVLFNPVLCGWLLSVFFPLLLIHKYFRGKWYHWKACRPNQSVLRKGAYPWVWKYCFNPCSRERLVPPHWCHAKSWRPCPWRCVNILLFIFYFSLKGISYSTKF